MVWVQKMTVTNVHVWLTVIAHIDSTTVIWSQKKELMKEVTRDRHIRDVTALVWRSEQYIDGRVYQIVDGS